MSFGGPETTTQISKVELPEWVDSASQSNYQMAQEIAAKPYIPYRGQTVADQSSLTTQGYDKLASGGANNQAGYDLAASLLSRAGQGSAYTGQAASLFAGLGNPSQYMTQAQNLLNKGGQGINALDRSKYMNPFEQDVINSTVQLSNDQLQQSLMGNADKAIAAKAFGGDRSGIVDGVTRAQANKDLSALVASLKSDNFNQATSAMQGDVNSMLAAGGAMAGLAGTDLQGRTSAAQGLAGLGNDEVNNWISAATGSTANQSAANKDSLTEIATLLSAGQQQQGYQQSLLDDEKAKFDERKNHDTEQLNLLLASLGMSPYGQTETTVKEESADPFDWASLGMGVLSLLPLLSDRSEKTDIKKVGEDPKTGIDLFSYRYKGDPKTYPKIVGPMAQDVEKKFPGSTKRINGKLTVPAGLLAGIANA